MTVLEWTWIAGGAVQASFNLLACAQMGTSLRKQIFNIESECKVKPQL